MLNQNFAHLAHLAMNNIHNQNGQLSVAECRDVLGDTNMTDKEIKELLSGLRSFLSRFLDDYFKEEFEENNL